MAEGEREEKKGMVLKRELRLVQGYGEPPSNNKLFGVGDFR
jgi:hypothetical protein